MPKALSLPPAATYPHLSYGYVEHFQHYNSGDRFTTVASDSGSVVVTDAARGLLSIIPSDGTVADNDETYVKGTNETYLFAADKPFVFEALVRFVEANTDDANIVVGLMSAVAANSLQDNGAGPAASYSGCVFFKVDGDTVWQAETSIGSSQVTTRLDAAGSLNRIAQTAGGAWQRLKIECRPISATKMVVDYFINGIHVAHHSDVTFTNATEMQEAFGVKNGSANLETLQVDYVSPWAAV